MNQLALGKDYYLFTTDAYVFINDFASLLSTNVGIDPNVFKPFRPTEEHFYDSDYPEQQKTMSFL
jgi:hypothetical protein